MEEKLLEKAKEAFILAIEIYNKPTIRYRVEGFSFFICNAWELMLKSYIIKTFNEREIYYKDKNDRTISLSDCIKKIFTNNKDPLRLNLEKIIELRDMSTHFITEEYEMLYIPLFQSCVFNFVEKMQQFHNFDMSTIISQNFLTLTVSMLSFNETEIRAKYPGQIAEKLLDINSNLISLVNDNNDGFAIKIEHHHYITKDKNKATELTYIDNSANSGVQIIKELKNPNLTHKYTMKKLNQEVNKRLKKYGILNINFNKFHFQLFCNYYEIKSNEKFCFINTIGETPTYSYSAQTIDFIVEEIKKDPNNIINNLKEKLKKRS